MNSKNLFEVIENDFIKNIEDIYKNNPRLLNLKYYPSIDDHLRYLAKWTISGLGKNYLIELLKHEPMLRHLEKTESISWIIEYHHHINTSEIIFESVASRLIDLGKTFIYLLNDPENSIETAKSKYVLSRKDPEVWLALYNKKLKYYEKR